MNTPHHHLDEVCLIICKHTYKPNDIKEYSSKSTAAVKRSILELNIMAWTDLAQVCKALQHMTLDLKEEMMEQDVYVIKDVK